jgi:hypothetical protein
MKTDMERKDDIHENNVIRSTKLVTRRVAQVFH